MKETVKQGAALKEEVPEAAVNGENTVEVDAADEFKGHRSRTLHGAQIATAVHCAAKGGIVAVDHFFNIFDDRVTGMKKINHFFIMVSKNILQYALEIIMQENSKKETPNSPHE